MNRVIIRPCISDPHGDHHGRFLSTRVPFLFLRLCVRGSGTFLLALYLSLACDFSPHQQNTTMPLKNLFKPGAKKCDLQRNRILIRMLPLDQLRVCSFYHFQVGGYDRELPFLGLLSIKCGQFFPRDSYHPGTWLTVEGLQPAQTPKHYDRFQHPYPSDIWLITAACMQSGCILSSWQTAEWDEGKLFHLS